MSKLAIAVVAAGAVAGLAAVVTYVGVVVVANAMDDIANGPGRDIDPFNEVFLS